MDFFDALADNTLVCDERELPWVQSYVGLSARTRRNGLCFVELPPPVEHTLNVLLHANLQVTPRLMRRFYFCHRKNSPQHSQCMINRFYATFSDNFEFIVDSQRNLENISLLTDVLEESIGCLRRKCIVDFGCGPGTAAPFSRRFSRIIGYDPCKIVRSRAAEADMETWGDQDLFSKRKYEIDGALSSYVMHVIPDTSRLHALWNRLRVDGAIVANFHRGIGVNSVIEYVRSMGGTIEEVFDKLVSGRHGRVMVFRKKENARVPF